MNIIAKLEKASSQDKDVVMDLYHSQIGLPGCTWDLDYPSTEEFDNDVKGNNLFCFKNDKNEIIAVCSITEPQELNDYDFWQDKKKPVELARLCVRSDYKNQGYARSMITKLFEYCKDNGYLSAHILVSPKNVHAKDLYKKLGFVDREQLFLYDKNWFAMEKLF